MSENNGAQKVWLASNDSAIIEVGKLAPLCDVFAHQY
jgi:hypothetical protein